MKSKNRGQNEKWNGNIIIKKKANYKTIECQFQSCWNRKPLATFGFEAMRIECELFVSCFFSVLLLFVAFDVATNIENGKLFL